MATTPLRTALADVNIRQSAKDEPLYIGKDTSNSMKVNDDGTIRLIGTSSTWTDMVGDVFGKRLLSSSGSVDYNFDENTIDFGQGGDITNSNDRVQWNQEIDHQFKVGANTTFYPHIHWFQAAATAYEFTLRYRLQRNGQAKTTAWTTIATTSSVANNIFTYVSGTLCQLTRFPDIVVDCGLSDTFQFQMTRTDSLGGTVSIYFMDLHGEIDSFGSDEEVSKS